MHQCSLGDKFQLLGLLSPDDSDYEYYPVVGEWRIDRAHTHLGKLLLSHKIHTDGLG